jgi:hypothetical protein
MKLRLLLVLIAVAVLAGTACSVLPGSAKASPSAKASSSPQRAAGDKLDPEVPVPPGFPADVPIYTGARLTAAASFLSSGQAAWGMEWQTLDGVDKVLAFYKTKFSQGDWQITVNGNANGAFAASYSRKSNSKLGGLLGADGSSGITRITLSLVVPT